MTNETQTEEQANSNCLEGIRCPRCGSHEPFYIGPVEIVLRVHDDGTEPTIAPGDAEWDDDTDIICEECRHSGIVSEFKPGLKSELPCTYYGMYSDEGNRAVGLLIHFTREGVKQGRERNLVTALVRDSITAIKRQHAEVTDTAVRERIYGALASIFLKHYGEPLTVDEMRPRRSSEEVT